MKKNAKPGYLIVSRDFIGDVLKDYTGGMTEEMAMLWLEKGRTGMYSFTIYGHLRMDTVQSENISSES